MRPAVLITDAYNALNNQPQRKQRDQEFIGKFLINFLCYLSQSLADRLEIFSTYVLKLFVDGLNNCLTIALQI